MKKMLKCCLVGMLITFELIGVKVWCADYIKHYPRIRPATLTLEVNSAKPEAVKTINIRDHSGRPAYEFTITAISVDKRTTMAIYLSLSGVGRYTPDANKIYEPNLLNPDRYGHGEGREVIRCEELCPANKSDTNYGDHRVFTLRRMKIIVDVHDFELSKDFCPQDKCGTQKGGLVKATATVSVQTSDSTRGRPIDIVYKANSCL